MLSHIVYLCSPYSHNDPDVRQQRFVEACKAAAHLMVEERVAVLSPIAHSHPISDHGGIPAMNHPFWMSQCMALLSMADELVVLKLDGWLESHGVRSEIAQAATLGIPVRYMEA